MKHFRPRLSRRAFWVLCALLVCLRLALTGFQQAYIWVGGAPLDDELMFRAANHITAGQWLGAYDYLTLSKAMFFPVWLALLHALHLPYLISGAALWCGAALLAAFAFSTLWRKKDTEQGRVLTLGLFAALAFLPSSWAAYTLRIYRDNIFPALCLYFFAGVAGMALRAVFTPEKPLWPWLAAAGAGLACGYLDREDAGLFLLPFAAAATVIVAVVLAGKRRWKALAAQAIPYVMLGVGVLTFCTLNYTHYGVFALSDFSEGSFAAAMGAMMRVDTDSTAPYLSVPADAREKIYDAVPELEPLAYWLEEDAQLQNDFRDPNLDDYRAGSFYWAIRRAAQFEGIYADAKTADAYWQIRSTPPATRVHCPAAPAGAWRRASRSRRLTSLRRWPRPGTAFGMCWACGTVRPMRRCGPSAPRTTLPPGPATCTAASTAPPTRGRTRPTTARTKRRFLPSCRAGRGSAVFCLRWACSAPCCASWQSFCRSGVKNARHRPLCRGCCCSASSALRCCAVP